VLKGRPDSGTSPAGVRISGSCGAVGAGGSAAVTARACRRRGAGAAPRDSRASVMELVVEPEPCISLEGAQRPSLRGPAALLRGALLHASCPARCRLRSDAEVRRPTRVGGRRNAAGRPRASFVALTDRRDALCGDPVAAAEKSWRASARDLLHDARPQRSTRHGEALAIRVGALGRAVPVPDGRYFSAGFPIACNPAPIASRRR